MLLDSHAHLNFNAFKDDADEVIRRSLSNNAWLINVGSQFETSKRAVAIAEKYPVGVYAAIGLHPIHVNTGVIKPKTDAGETESLLEDFDIEEYRQLALSSKKVVAIGEIGLDYYYKPKTKGRLEEFKKKQREVFEKQLDLANELGLPIIFHCRFAHEDLINILSSKGVKPPVGGHAPFTGFQASRLRASFAEVASATKAEQGFGGQVSFKIAGVIHCFTGTSEEARQYLAMGLYLGFNGIIFKLDLAEVIKNTPLEKMLIETDCPYLTPPAAGDGRNEPLYVKYVCEEIAKIKNLSLQDISEKTTANARNLFKI